MGEKITPNLPVEERLPLQKKSIVLPLQDNSNRRAWRREDYLFGYSCVGVYRNDHVEIIANDQGNRITPSWVAFTDMERLIGEAAKNQADLNAERTIFDVKRLIGRRFDDLEVQRDMKMLPYNIVNKNGKPYIEVKIKDGEVKVFSPEEISAMILGKMKETAESYLGKKIKDAVVTVPGLLCVCCLCSLFQRCAKASPKDAGTIAGLNVVRIINEPTAALIYYGLDKKGEAKNILVFDLRGSTLDSVLTQCKAHLYRSMMIFNLALAKSNFVRACISLNYVLPSLILSGRVAKWDVHRDTHLGGEDFHHRIMEYFIKLIKKKYNEDIGKDNKALGKLRKECERAKRALNSQHQVRVEIESLFDEVDFSELLTQARFEELNIDLFKKTMGPVKKAMKDPGLKKNEVDESGSTRIPKVWVGHASPISYVHRSAQIIINNTFKKLAQEGDEDVQDTCRLAAKTGHGLYQLLTNGIHKD
ncbi:hypothetical protein LguiB_021197 [Lonicera macranthoides]